VIDALYLLSKINSNNSECMTKRKKNNGKAIMDRILKPSLNTFLAASLLNKSAENACKHDVLHGTDQHTKQRHFERAIEKISRTRQGIAGIAKTICQANVK
jgi:hypothetical protein